MFTRQNPLRSVGKVCYNRFSSRRSECLSHLNYITKEALGNLIRTSPQPTNGRGFKEFSVTDPEGYEEYKRLAAPTVVTSGGRYLVRGGKAEVLAGDWEPKRIVVLLFDDVQQAKAWWGSEEYIPIKGIRHRTANSRMIVVEGV
jgi:uncharacterized protein (DUF1330 family)